MSLFSDLEAQLASSIEWMMAANVVAEEGGRQSDQHIGRLWGMVGE